MLKELRIKNYAVIDELNIEFKRGLNIMTGETGAGKSIIIESLGLILGDKVSDEIIRSGEDSATVEAVIDVSNIKKAGEILKDSGIEIDEDDLIIRRQVSRSGRNKNYINGNAVNLSTLRSIGNMLVDIHGQHEHQTLLYPENHCAVLDSFGNTEPLRELLRENYLKFLNLQREISALINKERERMQRIDLLNFQKDEIDKAGLKVGEDEELKKEKNLLQNAERLHQCARGVYELLYSAEGSVVEKLNAALANISEIAGIDSEMWKISEDVKAELFQIEDVALKMRDYTEKIEFNPDRLTEIEDRLAEISSLKRKYGATIDEILKCRIEADEELANLSHSQERMDELTAEIETIKEKLQRLSIELAVEREKAANSFESRMEKELKELMMEKVKFRVNFSYETDDNSFINYKGKPVKLFPEGIGRTEFFFSPNIGEDLKPLSKIASGGELSRVMLSIKNILTAKDSIPILIFDEVDTGIGGGVADVVGEKLKKVSRNRQVFCITHLPQIASCADAHFQITKIISSDRTAVSIKELVGKDRVNEIARMSGGRVITEATRRHAEEMVMKGG